MWYQCRLTKPSSCYPRKNGWTPRTHCRSLFNNRISHIKEEQRLVANNRTTSRIASTTTEIINNSMVMVSMMFKSTDHVIMVAVSFCLLMLARSVFTRFTAVYTIRFTDSSIFGGLNNKTQITMECHMLCVCLCVSMCASMAIDDQEVNAVRFIIPVSAASLTSE